MASKTRPFAPFEWMIAMRYLRPRRKEAFVSVISIISLVGIALGVAALIIVMAVMNGFRHDLLSRILVLQGDVWVQGYYGNITGYNSIAAHLRKLDGVENVVPVVDGEVLATSRGYSNGALVRGISGQDLNSLTLVSKTLSEGALERFRDGNAVIIGARLAQKMRLRTGMDITLVAPRGNVTPFGVTPRVKTYKIVGTFDVGISTYDETFVFMPIEEAQAYFNVGDAANQIIVSLNDPDRAIAMAAPIERIVGPSNQVRTWEDSKSPFFVAVEVERNVMFMILSLIILVAALNIISGLYMLVKNKGADIAILRTMGATRGAIMRVFLISGMTIGTAGTLLGFVVGYFFCRNIDNIKDFLSKLTGVPLFDPTIYFLEHMPARMEMDEVIATVAMALVLSFLATLYPSWRAASLDPVEALRYE
jgi:lipoprotein-releasing system permease protein